MKSTKCFLFLNNSTQKGRAEEKDEENYHQVLLPDSTEGHLPLQARYEAAVESPNSLLSTDSKHRPEDTTERLCLHRLWN